MQGSPPLRPSLAQITAIRRLQVDSVTLEIVGVLEQVGVPYVILKGPSTADWLYDLEHGRAYADTDVLVPLDDRERTCALLEQLGFEATRGRVHGTQHLAPRRDASHAWARAGAVVDVHHTIIGVNAAPATVWDAMNETAVEHDLGSRCVRVPGLAERALHIVLHAAQHGPRRHSPLVDLERLLIALPQDTWSDVRDVADRLGALEALAQGLQLRPQGEKIAEELGLKPPTHLETVLAATARDPAVFGIEVLRNTSGVRSKTRYVTSRLFPSREELDEWSPVSIRGWSRLAQVRLLRVLWVLSSIPGAAYVWLKTRRAMR